jgi:hypothetical protein
MHGVLQYARQIITFSLTNHDVTIENHTNHLETFLDQRSPQMVLVLTLGLTTRRIISRIPKNYFSKHSWIFWFERNKVTMGRRPFLARTSLVIRD